MVFWPTDAAIARAHRDQVMMATRLGRKGETCFQQIDLDMTCCVVTKRNPRADPENTWKARRARRFTSDSTILVTGSISE